MALQGEAVHWKLVLAAMLGIGLAAVPAYSLGLFMAPLAAEFGWTRAEVSLGISITSITALAAPFVGRLVDSLGARRIALPGAIFTCAAVGALGLTVSYPTYVATWIAIAIALALASPVVWTVAIANRFVANRGLALSIAFCGTSLMGAIAPLLSTVLIETLGWRMAWAGLAIVMLVICVPFPLLHFYDSRDLDRKGRTEGAAATPASTGRTLGEAMRTREFWTIGASFLIGGCCVLGFIMHFVPMLLDRGIGKYTAATAVSMLSVMAMVGRVGGGWLMDRTFAPHLAAAILLLPAMASALLAAGIVNGALVFVYAAMVGLAIGAEINLASYLAARYFGFRAYGTIYGILFGCFGAGYAAGPVIIGWVYDKTGSYILPLQLLAAGYLVSSLLISICRRYPDFSSTQLSISENLAPHAQ